MTKEKTVEVGVGGDREVGGGGGGHLKKEGYRLDEKEKGRCVVTTRLLLSKVND